MKKSFYIIKKTIFIFTSIIFFNSTTQSNLLIDNIAKLNMTTFPWEEKEWEEKNYGEFLKKSIYNRIHPKPRKKRLNAFEFYKKAEVQKKQKKLPIFTGPMTWSDLNLFCGNEKKDFYVGKIIDKTNLELGSISLLKTLANPLDNIDILQERQQIIKYFINNEQIANILQNTFASTILAENVMLSFWRVDNFKHASKKFYFNFPGSSWLNKYRNLLLIKSITAHQKRIGWIISAGLATGTLLTYSMLKACNINISEKLELWAKHYKSGVGQVLFSLLSFKKLQPVKQYINKITNNRLFACISAAGIGTTCALGIPESLRWSNQCFTIEDCVHKIMVQAAQFVKTMRTAYETIKADKTLSNYKEFKDLIIFFEEKVPQSQKLQELLKLLSYDTFGEKPSYFSHKGNILRTFRLMHEVKFEFKNALISIGAIDKWLSIAKLYKEFEHTNTPFCFTEYKKLEKPCIDLKMFWHPLIDTKKAIHNSITLGINNERQNIIVTGPNAGGKSTTLKAIALNIILSQTFGITSAKNATLTPFSLISTYLNITDDLGTGNSLFKAEVKRTDELLQAIEQLQPEQHKFVMFDEIFNGTSPLEGTASAYSVAKYISSQQNTICLVATHFKLLTELENTTDSFTNYKVSVEHQENGKIFYPYKIENGISDQHVAIDILRNEGFNSCILNEAQAIVKKLSTTNNEKQTSLQLK